MDLRIWAIIIAGVYVAGVLIMPLAQRLPWMLPEVVGLKTKYYAPDVVATGALLWPLVIVLIPPFFLWDRLIAYADAVRPEAK